MSRDPRRDSLDARLRHVRRDLEELPIQVDDGDLDEATATWLRHRYQADAAEIEALLSEEPTPRPVAPGIPADERLAREPSHRGASGGSHRALWIMVASIVVLTVVIIAMARSSGPDAVETTQSPVGPLDVTGADSPLGEMEAAVAADPTNNAMRLALAGMYFESGRLTWAMEHYLAVIDGDASPQEQSVALGRVGFLAYVTEQHDSAVSYLEQGIAADPENGENLLFMGVVQLYGIGDPEAAIPSFEAVLALPHCTSENISPCLPSELRLDVEAMLEEARAANVGSIDR